MLSVQNRLKKNKEYNYIYKKGESVFSKYLTLFYVKTKFIFKVGFSVSTKVGNSVTRHKLKRRMAHIIREYLPKINPANNYIILARTGSENLTYDELKSNIDYILKKSKNYGEF